MKKKIMLLFALLLVALLAFTACSNGPSVADLQSINDMLKANYSSIKVVINTSTSTADLNGVFTLTFDGNDTKINYQFDRLNTFDIDGSGNVSDAQGGYIVSEEGEVVVRDGKIIDGDTSVDLPLDQLTIGGFSFKQAFFSNVNTKDAQFEADVVNPQNFTGNSSLVCSNMHVVVVRNTSAKVITSILLTYTSESGASVKINYLFTK